jgi:PPK2 family polyphosphate:nucleotide phosphotransferase
MAFKPEKYLAALKVKPSTKVSLKKYRTNYDIKGFSDGDARRLLLEGINKLAKVHDKLYADNQYSVLIVLQGMDAAGKDSIVKHVMTGLNPQGVGVTSFKVPTSTELDHDYLWRHYLALPPRGEIGIFNRSHYENVLVTKVHPDFILNEKLPGIHTVKDIKPDFWKVRYKEINRFEKNLVENGTVILKFFLHISKEIQKRRFIERIDDPTKNWKFSLGDIKERERWDDYQYAYEKMLSNTSTSYAPWFVIPADDKGIARVFVAELIYEQFEKLEISYPKLNVEQKDALIKARQLLMSED